MLILFAWLLSYFVEYWLLRYLTFQWLHILLGVGVVLGAFVVAVLLTGIVLRPIRGFMFKLKPPAAKVILGRSAVIRSPTVTPVLGSASVEDGGAGLILQVRDDMADRFKRGDRVVLIEYLAEQNAYRVIGEDEFKGL